MDALRHPNTTTWQRRRPTRSERYPTRRGAHLLQPANTARGIGTGVARESPRRIARARPRRPTRECFVAFFGRGRWPRMDSRSCLDSRPCSQAGPDLAAIHGAAQSMEQEVGRPDGTGASSPRAPHRIVDTCVVWIEVRARRDQMRYEEIRSEHRYTQVPGSPSEFGPLSLDISFFRQGFPGYSRTSSSQKKLEARVLDPTQSHPTRNSHS